MFLESKLLVSQTVLEIQQAVSLGFRHEDFVQVLI